MSMTDPLTPLDAHMREAKLSDAELARKVGVSRPYIARIRGGDRTPSLKVAIKIAAATQLPVDQLARGAA